MTKKEALLLKPCNGNVVVVDDPPKEKTSGGIFIPKGDKTNALILYGTVLASSPIPLLKSKDYRAPEVKPGDKVIYNFLSGVKGLSEKDSDNPDIFYRVIEHSGIVAKIKKKNEKKT